jgi:hypothetical protein
VAVVSVSVPQSIVELVLVLELEWNCACPHIQTVGGLNIVVRARTPVLQRLCARRSVQGRGSCRAAAFAKTRNAARREARPTGEALPVDKDDFI